MAKHGKKTTEIAKLLKDKLEEDNNRYEDVETKYDHGDRPKDPDVCRPLTYMGKRYGNDATLSGVDIVVLKENRVLVLVEVEERTTRPKTILGDVFGIALAENIRIQGKRYPMEDAILVVAVVVPDSGMLAKKYKRLERHINKHLDAIRKNKQLLRSLNKVRIVPSTPKGIVSRIERLVRLEIGKRV